MSNISRGQSISHIYYKYQSISLRDESCDMYGPGDWLIVWSSGVRVDSFSVCVCVCVCEAESPA